MGLLRRGHPPPKPLFLKHFFSPFWSLESAAFRTYAGRMEGTMTVSIMGVVVILFYSAILMVGFVPLILPVSF